VQDFGDSSSAAQRAGLRAGDVIVAVDGKPVSYVAQLQQSIAFRSAGEQVNVEVARKGGQRVTVRVPLQRVSATIVSAARGSDADSRGSASTASSALGIRVSPVDAATARQLHLPADVQGVVVMDVLDGSTASAHLATPETGGPDIIQSVEDMAVHTPAELQSALRAVRSGDVVTLRVYNVPNKSHRIERMRVGAP
jgi:serine protease Do